jgi:hypothetical protein
MHKAILMMILALGCSNALADWAALGEREGLNTYYNPGSIRKAGNMVKMEHLFDLSVEKEVAGKLFRSITVDAEYNCKEGQTRALSSDAHSGRMGLVNVDYRSESDAGIGVGRGSGYAGRAGRAGIVNSINEPGKWKPVAPGSTVEILWKIACGKE